jgi:YHS domain-containing protein
MKTVSMMVALAVLSLGTLGVQPAAMAAAKAASKTAAKAKAGKAGSPKMAVCPVCAVKEGKKVPEPVKASLKYKGKTYYFCNLQDKAEFISNPAKYAGAVK